MKCLQCNKEFVAKKPVRRIPKYCSVYCRKVYWRINNPEKFETQRKNYVKSIYADPILHAKRKAYQNKRNKMPTTRYTKYKASAKYRHYKWNLTKKQFMTFWEKDCYYCGDKIEGVGIDRLDNSKGYSIRNCVACCKQCNVMKNNHTLEEFIIKCKQIVQNVD